jgi:hypothetical protein
LRKCQQKNKIFPKTNEQTPTAAQTKNTQTCRGRRLDVPKINAYHRTNKKRTNSVGEGLAPPENKRPPPQKKSIGHPERTQYAKFCVGEKPQSGASGAKPRNGATRNDDGISLGVLLAFSDSNILFVHTEQFIYPRKAIGNRLEISSSQAAGGAPRLFAAHFVRLQKASRATHAQDDL